MAFIPLKPVGNRSAFTAARDAIRRHTPSRVGEKGRASLVVGDTIFMVYSLPVSGASS